MYSILMKQFSHSFVVILSFGVTWKYWMRRQLHQLILNNEQCCQSNCELPECLRKWKFFRSILSRRCRRLANCCPKCPFYGDCICHIIGTIAVVSGDASYSISFARLSPHTVHDSGRCIRFWWNNFRIASSLFCQLVWPGNFGCDVRTIASHWTMSIDLKITWIPTLLKIISHNFAPLLSSMDKLWLKISILWRSHLQQSRHSCNGLWRLIILISEWFFSTEYFRKIEEFSMRKFCAHKNGYRTRSNDLLKNEFWFTVTFSQRWRLTPHSCNSN